MGEDENSFTRGCGVVMEEPGGCHLVILTMPILVTPRPANSHWYLHVYPPGNSQTLRPYKGVPSVQKLVVRPLSRRVMEWRVCVSRSVIC